MKKTITKPKPNFFTKNKDLLIAGGAIVLLAGVGATWYYLKKKKGTLKKNDLTSAGLTSASVSSSGRLNTPVRPNSTPLSSISTTSSGYPIKYGSRHADVKVLQRYLKIYKADLGSTGPKRDGVDGIFGPKTARASKKQLGKSVFTTSDIDGMRRTLKTMGK